MPSGITHILLMKELINQLPDGDLKMVLSAGKDFLQVGALGPDLPYASIADSDFIFSSQSDMADKFHYIKTNEIPLKAFKEIQRLKTNYSPLQLAFNFSFFLGYLAHVVADGIMHPYIRDKVGDYAENQTEHRILEMKLDVLLYYKLTESSNYPIELNYSNLHDELKNFNYKTYPEINQILTLFSNLIKNVYLETYTADKILDWVTGLHRMFDLAEGRHWFIYDNIPFINDFLFKDYTDIIANRNELVNLTTPKDRNSNFLKTDQINFFDDVLPKFFSVFIPIAQNVYQYVYLDGQEITDHLIKGIDLDTGRSLTANNNLDLIPSFWS